MLVICWSKLLNGKHLQKNKFASRGWNFLVQICDYFNLIFMLRTLQINVIVKHPKEIILQAFN